MRWKSIGTAGAAIAAAAGLGIGGAALATAKEEPTAAVTPSGLPSAPGDMAGGDCAPLGESRQPPGAGPGSTAPGGQGAAPSGGQLTGS